MKHYTNMQKVPLTHLHTQLYTNIILNPPSNLHWVTCCLCNLPNHGHIHKHT
jgi:hypothetical protein